MSLPFFILEPKLNIQEDVPLAPFTTLKVGGNARFFVRVRREDELVEAIEHARQNALDVFILGGGSNVLVADAGFDGLVIHIQLKGIDVSDSTVTAAAGENWDESVQFCVERGLAGIECMSGIPGFVGGTPVQNVGAYGQEVSETIESVKCFDRQERSVVTLLNKECEFTYRTSIFNSTARDRYVVLGVTYRLTKGGAPKIAYKDLQAVFETREPSLAEVRETVVRIRKAKSMVIDPGDPNSRSAGSFFKNPVVDIGTLERMRDAFPDAPSFPFGDKVKISAAWLIERSGFYKGFRQRRAGISSNHSLALVNCGGATAAEIIELKTLIQESVEGKFGISLVPEPVFVGFPQKS